MEGVLACWDLESEERENKVSTPSHRSADETTKGLTRQTVRHLAVRLVRRRRNLTVLRSGVRTSRLRRDGIRTPRLARLPRWAAWRPNRARRPREASLRHRLLSSLRRLGPRSLLVLVHRVVPCLRLGLHLRLDLRLLSLVGGLRLEVGVMLLLLLVDLVLLGLVLGLHRVLLLSALHRVLLSVLLLELSLVLTLPGDRGLFGSLSEGNRGRSEAGEVRSRLWQTCARGPAKGKRGSGDVRDSTAAI